MASKEYIERLQVAVQHLHGCSAVHVATSRVTEVFQGRTIWHGLVETFDLRGHPQAKRAYAWTHRIGEDDSGEVFVAVLEIPPVISPESAVKVSLAAEIKGKR